MQRITRFSSLAAALVASAVAAGAAHADGGDAAANDAMSAAAAPVSLVRAIEAAEQGLHGGLHGRATRAAFEQGRNGGVYEVEVVSAGRAFDVTVDAASGKVLSFQADRPDGHRGRDGEDEDGGDDRED